MKATRNEQRGHQGGAEATAPARTAGQLELEAARRRDEERLKARLGLTTTSTPAGPPAADLFADR